MCVAFIGEFSVGIKCEMPACVNSFEIKCSLCSVHAVCRSMHNAILSFFVRSGKKEIAAHRKTEALVVMNSK